MVGNRKRKRPQQLGPLNPGNEYEGPPPPPFAPARHSMYKSYMAPLSRNLVQGLAPAYVNLVIIAGERLRARDFASAAAALPALFKRYRKNATKRWFFTREIAVTGAEVLRRVSWAPQVDLLDDFLAQMSRDGHLSVRGGPEGYSEKAREAVLLERAMELLAVGRVKAAFECLHEQSQDKLFQESALVHGYLGVVALAASGGERDPSVLLRIAANALHTASEIEPTAYFYAYYAAAAAMAAGKKDDALKLLRTFVEERHRTDPVALYGVLSCLSRLEKKDSDHIRKERVDIARRLLVVDPLCSVAMDVLIEANAWQWTVQPRVDTLEVAEILGSRIEHGNVADVNNWTALGQTLWGAPAEQRVFWEYSGRNKWWPSHFFRVAKLNADITANPVLASVKGAVANMLCFPEPSLYAKAVEASGIVNLFKFDSNE